VLQTKPALEYLHSKFSKFHLVGKNRKDSNVGEVWAPLQRPNLKTISCVVLTIAVVVVVCCCCCCCCCCLFVVVVVVCCCCLLLFVVVVVRKAKLEVQGNEINKDRDNIKIQDVYI